MSRVEIRGAAMTPTDPSLELQSVAARYEDYLVLARITDIPRYDPAPVEFYEPRPAPLTLTITAS
jgi:hypothetical protein